MRMRSSTPTGRAAASALAGEQPLCVVAASRTASWVGLLAALLALAGCEPPGPEPGDDLAAVAIGDHEDPVCGMLVRNQSAPRGQVVHSDGTRQLFCSVGDMLVYLSAPSRHGAVVATFVEVMEADEDPSQSHTGPHRWRRVEQASYVVGVARQGIMGEPVLAYADAAEAARAALGRDGARVLDFDALEAWWRALQATR